MANEYIVNDWGKREVGRVHKANGTWFANPKGSQIQLIPCQTLREAIATVEKLGTA